jgi:hypothetical protein
MANGMLETGSTNDTLLFRICMPVLLQLTAAGAASHGN